MQRALLTLSISIAAMLASPAAGQDVRSTELIERALQAKPDTSAGKKIYNEHCTTCHGARGYGNAEQVIPALAGQLPIYVIKQLVDLSERSRTSADMHRIAARKPLTTPQALRDIATYLGTLDPNPKPETGDGAQLAMGKRYYQGLCAYCHGAQGGGNEAHATPALRRQHYSYLLMQMRDLSADHRYSVDIEIVDTLRQLSYDQLSAIADYASRLPMAGSSVVDSEQRPSQPAQSVTP
ncbi:c-type cytochrome [Peristeroidobacter agariperforans]|uniref:c-type cytochrome n=1 Tax=Peristeroidobacter agariperforans TaxID=268404 RepID=UPI0018E54AA6|nr:c-type cytochrome [Peristeroidobacter agariperforans]